MKKTLYLILLLSIIPSDLALSEQAVSPTGIITFKESNFPQPTSIKEIDLNTLRTREILRSTNERPYIRQFRYAPDNQHFVVMMGSIENDQADTELYIGHQSGGQLKRLTDNNIFEGYPVWSADSKKIAFMRGIISATNKFYVIDVESMQEKQVPEPDLNIHRWVDWLPDGNRLVVVANSKIGTREDKEISRLAIIYLTEGTSRWLTKGDASILTPRLSPDRTKIVCVAQSRNADFNWTHGQEFIQRICVLDIDETQMQPLGDSADEYERQIWPVWSPNGKRIAWFRINIKERTVQVLVYNLESNKFSKISLPGEMRGQYSLLWSPDNEHLTCMTYQQLQDYTLYIIALKNNVTKEVMNTKSGIQCLYWR